MAARNVAITRCGAYCCVAENVGRETERLRGRDCGPLRSPTLGFCTGLRRRLTNTGAVLCDGFQAHPLLVIRPMRSRFLVDPVLLGPLHALPARNVPTWAWAVLHARLRVVAEGLEPVADNAGVPLVDDHLDRHPAASDANAA